MVDIFIWSIATVKLFGLGPLLLLLPLYCTVILAAPDSAHSILTCRSTLSASSLPKAANGSGFATVPKDRSCNSGYTVELFCGPRNHTSMYWIVWNATGVYTSSGSQTSDGSTLRVPCGNYTLQCVAELETRVYSRPILISKDEDYIQTEPTEGKVVNETTKGNEENINITDENNTDGNYQTNILDTSSTEEQNSSPMDPKFTTTKIAIIVVCLVIVLIVLLSVLLIILATKKRRSRNHDKEQTQN